MLISESITKIRRLINDDSSVIFSDAHILALFGRAQQRFCKETLCLIKAVSMMAPPELDYAFSRGWEEGYLSGRRFNPFFGNSRYACSQPFEQTKGYDLASNGNTLTSGVDLLRSESQHPIPFFPPLDYFSPKGLLWNYKWVEQESYLGVDNYYIDGWERRGDVVDFFSHAKGLRQRAFYLRGMPYASEQPVNMLLHSRELDHAYWTAVNSPTLTQNEKGSDGQANMAWTIEDDSASLYEYISRSFDIATANIGYYCASVDVKKDSDETRFVSFQFGGTSISSTNPSCQLNTRTGEVNKATEDAYTIGVIDAGTFWRIWLTAETTVAGDISVLILPAVSGVKGIVDVSGVGSAVFDFVFLEKGESPTLRNGENLVGQQLSGDVLHLFYVAVPGRADAVTDRVELQENFVKYLEYKVASRLLKSDTEIRDEVKAKHYDLRYSIGIKLVKKVIGNLMSGKVHQFGTGGIGIGRKPPYPRLPDHYPKLGVR